MVNGWVFKSEIETREEKKNNMTIDEIKSTKNYLYKESNNRTNGKKKDVHLSETDRSILGLQRRKKKKNPVTIDNTSKS